MWSGDVPWLRPLSRRSLLGGMAAGAGGIVLARAGIRPASAATAMIDLGGVAVVPRHEWGGYLAPAGPIPAEPDVRYLLVHHSVDPGNDYTEGDVVGVLRGFVRNHTSPDKGWPDLAYNFLVDRFGRVWEGRTGSLAGPVAGDATGGNQGFDQLCCFIGNHQAAQPSAAAFDAMARLLRALAARYDMSLADGATATFTSRGSNRHPAGAVVTTPTVAGHRDMSRTQCPGDLVAARLGELRVLAAGAAPPQATNPPAAPPAPPAPPATATPAPPPAAPAPTSPATTTGTPGQTVAPVRPQSSPTGAGAGWVRPVTLGTGTAAALAAAAGVARAARRHQDPDSGP